MQWLFCSDDSYLLARWRSCGKSALECRPEHLPRHLLKDETLVCALDANALSAETLSALLQTYPSHRFLVTVSRPQPEQAVALLAQGVRGYANRQLNPQVLAIAMETVANGELWAGADTIAYLLAQQQPATNAAPPEFSERENEVAEGVVQGLSNKQIGAQLGITERTVKAHLKSCYQKAGCDNRLQLALKLGGPPEQPAQVV